MDAPQDLDGRNFLFVVPDVILIKLNILVIENIIFGLIECFNYHYLGSLHVLVYLRFDIH
jgi:hypothetical protein